MRTLDAINQELAAASQELEQAKQLEVMLKDVQEQQLRCRQTLEQAKTLLEKEEQDVEEIERFSFASVVARIKGELKERTEREQREVAAAKARCDAANSDLEELERRSQNLQMELDHLGERRGHYEQLLREKEAIMRSNGTPSAQRLDEVLRRIEVLEAQLREVEEACAAGRDALLELEHMSNELANTAGWDHLDLMGGENVHATIRKERVGSARQQSEKACAALGRLRRELWDVVFQNVPDVQLDDFTSFTDCLDEGIFDDIFVQEKLQQAQDCVTDALCEVEHTLALVDERRDLLRKQRDELEKERLELLK